MGNRRGNTAVRKVPFSMAKRDDKAALRSHFADRDQVLVPLLELIEDARTSVDELMAEAARSFIERLLMLCNCPGIDVIGNGGQPGHRSVFLEMERWKRNRLIWDGPGSVRRDEVVWRELVAAHQASGLTVSAFCSERGVPRSSFGKWRRRLGMAPTKERRPPAAKGFLPLSIAGANTPPAETAIELDVGPMRFRVSGAAATRIVDSILARIAA